MSFSDITLLLHFLVEGIKAIKVFIVDEEVRSAFQGLKNAQTDDEKSVIAQKIAQLVYSS